MPGAADSLGEAVRGGEDPPVRDEAAPAEVASVSLNADLPRPLSLQGVLPAHHPIQHPRAPAGWGNRAGAGLGGRPSPSSDSHPKNHTQAFLSCSLRFPAPDPLWDLRPKSEAWASVSL